VAGAGATAMDADGGSDDLTAEELLNDTSERYATAQSLVTTANVTVSNGTANATATVEMAAAENGTRIAVTGANATYRAGTNGSVVWYAGPNRTVVYEHDALPQRLASSDPNGTAGGWNATGTHHATNASVAGPLALASGDGNGNATVQDRLVNGSFDPASYADAELVRTGEDDGIEAHVVRLTPNASLANATDSDRDVRVRLWIATDDARLLRAVATDDTNTTVVDYERTRFNVSVHESTFDPPTDRVAVTSFDRYGTFAATQTNTSLDLPALDASFREAGVVQRPEGTFVAQRYRADGDNVTVVSTTVDRETVRDYLGDGENATGVTVDGREATLVTVRNGEATAVYWRTDGVATAVVVDADADRTLELARSLAAAE